MFPRHHDDGGTIFDDGGTKPVMPKKKKFVARNLKDFLPNLPLRTGKAKKKIKVFLSRQFCVSLNYELVEKRHPPMDSTVKHAGTS